MGCTSNACCSQCRSIACEKVSTWQSLPSSATASYSSREEIDEQYRWDLSSIFESDEAFLAALEEAKKLPPRCAAFQGKISASAADLLAYLKLDDEAGLILTKLANYAERKSDEDALGFALQRFFLVYLRAA